MTDFEKIRRSMLISSETRLEEIELDPDIVHVWELVAEVRRLRDGLALIEMECMETAAALGGALQHAFENGARQMRDAAALCAEYEETQLPLRVATAIRAIPLPEYRDE